MWIFDSGASHHVFLNMKCFCDISVINPIHIHLPNGNYVTANYVGSVIFDIYLHLHDVFTSPDFNLALYSYLNYVTHLITTSHSYTIHAIFRMCLPSRWLDKWNNITISISCIRYMFTTSHHPQHLTMLPLWILIMYLNPYGIIN